MNELFDQIESFRQTVLDQFGAVDVEDVAGEEFTFLAADSDGDENPRVTALLDGDGGPLVLADFEIPGLAYGHCGRICHVYGELASTTPGVRSVRPWFFEDDFDGLQHRATVVCVKFDGHEPVRLVVDWTFNQFSSSPGGAATFDGACPAFPLVETLADYHRRFRTDVMAETCTTHGLVSAEGSHLAALLETELDTEAAA